MSEATYYNKVVAAIENQKKDLRADQTSPVQKTLSQLFVDAGLEAVRQGVTIEANENIANYIRGMATERNEAQQRALKAEAELEIVIARKQESDERVARLAEERNAAAANLAGFRDLIWNLKQAEKDSHLYDVFKKEVLAGGY